MTQLATSRVCLVTGAGRGIGRAVVARLAADGHRIALVARSLAEIDAVSNEVSAPTLTITADVTQSADVERMFATVEDTWGPVEVLVSNAGSGDAAALVDTSDEHWQRALDLNLTAPFRCIRRALPSMLEVSWGRIIVVASVVAKRGEAQVGAYTASKHGVLGLVRSAAAEVARRGVTVNAICPGYVDTPMTGATIAAISARTGVSEAAAADRLARRQPIGRLVVPAEVAEAVNFCIVNAAVTGQGINVDGGAVQS